MRQIHLGKPKTEEHKRKISKSKKGVLFFEKSKNVYQYNIDGILIKEWESAKQAEVEGGFNHKNINQCCRGKKKTHKGYIWRYE